jgi:CheY-like chemotaxis protein
MESLVLGKSARSFSARPVAFPGEDSPSFANRRSILPDIAMKILIVEDHIDSADAMARVMRKLGHDPITADTCVSAIQAVQQSKFDLAVCELNLLDGDGWKLMRALRDVYQIRAIAVTGHGDGHHRQRCEEEGFAFVLEPLQVEQLRQAIDGAA